MKRIVSSSSTICTRSFSTKRNEDEGALQSSIDYFKGHYTRIANGDTDLLLRYGIAGCTAAVMYTTSTIVLPTIAGMGVAYYRHDIVSNIDKAFPSLRSIVTRRRKD